MLQFKTECFCTFHATSGVFLQCLNAGYRAIRGGLMAISIIQNCYETCLRYTIVCTVITIELNPCLLIGGREIHCLFNVMGGYTFL